jgi:type VI secretion system secreted protein VgrG
VELFANKKMQIVSTEDKVEVAAEKEILLTSGGAYIKIKDGHIYMHAPGIIEFKASSFPFKGPTALNVNYDLPKMEFDPVDFKQQAAFIVSSHPQGKGLLYTNEPYKLYENGALIQEGLTDDKAAIVYERKPDAQYKVELVSGHTFNLETQQPTQDKQEILARSLGLMGHRYTGEENAQESSSDILTNYFKRPPDNSET